MDQPCRPEGEGSLERLAPFHVNNWQNGLDKPFVSALEQAYEGTATEPTLDSSELKGVAKA